MQQAAPHGCFTQGSNGAPGAVAQLNGPIRCRELVPLRPRRLASLLLPTAATTRPVAASRLVARVQQVERIVGGRSLHSVSSTQRFGPHASLRQRITTANCVCWWRPDCQLRGEGSVGVERVTQSLASRTPREHQCVPATAASSPTASHLYELQPHPRDASRSPPCGGSGSAPSRSANVWWSGAHLAGAADRVSYGPRSFDNLGSHVHLRIIVL